MAPFSFLSAVLPRTESAPETITAGDPILPPELERQIFELACINNPCCAYNVIRVSRRTYQWIHPFLYHSLTFSDVAPTSLHNLSTPQHSKLLQDMNHNRPSVHHRHVLSYLKKYTRRLTIAVDSKFPASITAPKFLALTPNVTHLISRDRCIQASDEYIWNLTSLPLQHLYFILGQLSPFLSYSMLHPNLRWASNLTHLIYYGSIAETLDLNHFPNLSHFASSRSSFDTITVPLERPSFKVCIWFTIWTEDPNGAKQQLAPNYPKVVFLPQKKIIKLMVATSTESWDGFEDLWNKAERIAERQKLQNASC